ncbi:hypothetical protein A3D05_02735 [Candidatus Gottesmanbacteria bacterium RIFCSPHIGHO2_02_FULL_40_24]|uniref:Glycosyltransferase 2-like domain-containing protein n=1 Tax=Candidatus Gottesmanbacteria bacterium RIFCSPHIGHO2_01_FULL_40_15 TaxID=1798376 RepID=A0A1F5Z7C5_9BACT|nr:MAG: hypothetical protein A2777_06240 [Candidatus Gottesmanbacteria bacterium RIFCSPHIGHO2_01_FULL_40_15]OGG18103.1 MAG: hypothetical protein A3D05_02735 [Candidatus Gottesmanbacteria bacterium RIFCSPHIGHO2_02_FULL_40_24]OGG21024.1 MAG: hypothetical protein A3B48_03725 [Candidatus Gottesmanbacteria bacterium RIFCSPLOWO2_01_FULL_40_10]OGG25046.1 MAG: hypothetical protein A3E42_05120 [Candidatus Gottesmanbacteria bacterium RIFCSPHIGHO2_12_FULL_40_13]
MRNDGLKLSVVLPTYNEADNIILLIEEIRRNLEGKIEFEIIVVDDNSPDKTGIKTEKKYIKKRNIRIFVRKEKGLATAILHGLRKARGKFVCVMDTDFNHDPKVLMKMYKKLSKYDLIVGSRYVSGGGMENRLRNYLSLIYNRLIQFILALPTRDNLSGFFMSRKDAIEELLTEKIFRGYGDYFIRLVYAGNNKGLLITEIPVYYKNRIHGVSKSKFFTMFLDYSRTVIELILTR